LGEVIALTRKTDQGFGFNRAEKPFRAGRVELEPTMGDWISDVLLFSAGVVGGILVSMISSSRRASKQRRTEVVAMRARILADMKEQHDKEILHAAFRTTEDIRGELNKSLQTLRKTVTTVLDPVKEVPKEQRNRVVEISKRIKPK
jgi:hypothetical protein